MGIAENLLKMFSREGKTVLFTGAGGGIGGELASTLAGAGASVALCDINADALDKRKKTY
ncbi:MAG TPA: SDR family NAD(P)-dependent oxidoreductase [Oscillospiraceae bacterium]|nr:SDR family NAD(P)-dependent oxidoreductase [Oscillospiraceae bacterium]